MYKLNNTVIKIIDEFTMYSKSNENRLNEKQDELNEAIETIKELTSKLDEYKKAFEKIEEAIHKPLKNIFIFLLKPFIKTTLDDIIIILNIVLY